MADKVVIRYGVIITLILLLAGSAFGRTKIDADKFKDFQGSMAVAYPIPCIATHRVGKIALSVTTNGSFGNGFADNIGASEADCFTGQSTPSCQYPKGALVDYLFAGAIWIGAVVGRDTLVSVGADGWSGTVEMFPDDGALFELKGVQGNGLMLRRSIIDPNEPEFEGAISEEDFVTVYTDTFYSGSNPPIQIDPDYFGRPHRPLYIQVKEESYAWSYAYAEDFVLFDYQIKNVGFNKLKNVYMGIYVDADVCYDCEGTTGFTDDICGFVDSTIIEFQQCSYKVASNIAWIADNDGDFDKLEDQQVPDVTATRIVRTPAKKLDVSFNWWISNGSAPLDFGPRQKPCTPDFYRVENEDTTWYWVAGEDTIECPEFKQEFRSFLGNAALGTPEGDVNKYYIMRNKEFDYDQYYTCAIQQNDPLWMYPQTNPDACDFADGFDTRYLLSFGPFNIDPGQKLPITLAYLGGQSFHTDKENIYNLPDDPEAYRAGLNFDDLGDNSVWASWIYDNPGVDTDGDGYYGVADSCVIDSTPIIDTLTLDTIGWDLVWEVDWLEGDGVPDFKGASPPPAPDFWIEPAVGKLRIRFNGTRSETTTDVFSHLIDFEGYRINIARDPRASSYSVVASYDREDYNKYVYDFNRDTFKLAGVPLTMEQLRAAYGSDFDPLAYNRSHLFIHPQFPDSQFYFEPQDYNQSELGLPGGIRKLYPDQPYPSHLNPDSARPDELTEDGYLKYFEYEYVIEDLLPTVSYWVNVTAFDFGSPESGLEALETSVTVGSKSAYPLSSADEVARRDLKVFVYPNPYRIDAGYRALGFEGRNIERVTPDDKVRAIHFANLPPKCTIRIFTLDGDLVREIHHDFDPSDPNASHDTWDLITRNTQLVVSGLYYWTVEADNGETQIGKLVIIM
ncbi:MAG: hypothetical protein ACE5K8_06065 [Candidatus Zixiibacteriota bacterium]